MVCFDMAYSFFYGEGCYCLLFAALFGCAFDNKWKAPSRGTHGFGKKCVLNVVNVVNVVNVGNVVNVINVVNVVNVV